MTLSLDPTAKQRAALLQSVHHQLEAFLQAQEKMPMATTAPSVPPTLGECFPPRSGIEMEQLCDFLFSSVVPPGLNTAGPGHFAFIPGGGLYASALADMIGSVVNKFTGSLSAAPHAAALESNAARGIARWLGMPNHAGIFTSGGSMSTLAALCAAREKLVPDDYERATVYLSDQTHFSFSKSARLVGFRKRNIRRIGTTAGLRVDLRELSQRIQADRRAGLKPMCICGNAGTATLGIVDPLDALADIADQSGTWFHVDAAYGGFFATLPELSELFSGIARADSVVVDPHKGMFLPYGTGLLLVKNLFDLRRAHGTFADGSTELEEPFELGPELSRGWRGLRVWLPLMLHGRDAFEEAWRQRRSWAIELWELLDEEPLIETGPAPELSLFGFRLNVPGLQEPLIDEVNKVFLEMLNSSARFVFSGAWVNDTYFLRVCVLHLRTDKNRVKLAGEWIIAEAGRLAELIVKKQSRERAKDA